jgi:hypothetical protein
MNVRFTVLWLFCAVLAGFLSCSRKSSPPPQTAFYFWQTVYRPDSPALHYLREAGASRLYVRCFDVDTARAADGSLQVQPVSVLRSEGAWPEQQDIVPVVYLTRQALRRGLPADTFAARIARLLQQVVMKNRWKIREVQWDHDWTPSTREPYFALLQALRRHPSLEKLKFSATIRLHQIRYRSRTGLPPVDRGLLMCYNMGKLKQPGSANSLFDADLCREYLQDLSDYPLPLDPALPLFRWAVQFRGGRFHALLNAMPEDSAAGRPLQPLGKHLYRCTASCTLMGYRLQTGDELRFEAPDPQDLQAFARWLLPRLPVPPHFLAFFDWPPDLHPQFTPHVIRTIVQAT